MASLSKTPLEDVACACLPRSALGALAGLRRLAGVSVRVEGDRAWVWWEPGEGRVLRAVLPVEGVELFEERGEEWFRAGRRLPAPGVPDRGGSVPIDRAVLPSAFEASSPGGERPRPARLRLARGGGPRPSSALLCPLVEVARWAEWVPSGVLGAIRGAISGPRVLLLGEDLPPLAGSQRFWGRLVLTPLGFECRPRLGEGAIVEAFGAGEDAVLRLAAGGPEGGEATVEAIPLAAFGPLTRAGVRLAGGTWPP